jgi:hypothetical protein
VREVLRLVVVVLVCTAVARWCGASQTLSQPPALDQQLADKGLQVITAALGPGRGHVVVNVELGETRRLTDVKAVGPERVMTGSQEKTESYVKDTDEEMLADPPTDNKNYRQSVSSYKWEVSRRDDKLQRTSLVHRISAGVIVYDAAPEEVDMLRPVLESALGLDKTRGDRLEIGVCKR